MRATIADITDDLVLYRDLEPCDGSLPGLRMLREALGIAPGQIPRKRQRDYARVVVAIIEAALAQRAVPAPQSFVVIGDTENDRQFAAHLRAVSGLPTLGFIGNDAADAPSVSWDGDTATANRWSLLHEVLEEGQKRGMIAGRGLVVLIDIDKTLLGPRGRNDAATDVARLRGALAVGRQLLGQAVDASRLERVYRALCNAAFHPFTLDNQDIVVYTTLLVLADVIDLDVLQRHIERGDATPFAALLRQITPKVPQSLRASHEAVQTTLAAGDPTAFKAFRREEFRALVELMAAGDLMLCDEVLSIARRLRAAGALCVAASDKPGEASLPSLEQAAAGLLPVHRTPALVG